MKKQAAYFQGYWEGTFKRLQAIAQGLEGEVRVGFVGSAMQNVIPQLITKCNKIYPDIHFVLDEMSNKAQIEAIQNNSIDLISYRQKDFK